MTPLAPSPPPPAGEARAPVAARAPGRPGPPACRDGRDQCQQGDAFDRLLRGKAGESESEPPQDATAADAGPAAGLLALAGWLPAAPSALLAQATSAAAPSPPPSAAPAETATPAAQAVFETAADDAVMPPTSQTVASDAMAWQVTLKDPRGLPVELQVSRPEGHGAELAPWSLTVGAGAQHATLLAQHAQRLGERLRARAVALSHLRVESDGDPPHSD